MQENTVQTKLVQMPEGYFEIAPRPTSEELAAYYRDKYFGSRDGRTPYAHGYTAEELEHKQLQPAETELVWNRPPGRLLEVGVGEGFTLDYFLQRGWKAKGLDFTDDGVREFFPYLAEHLMLGDAFALLDGVIAAGETFDLVVCNNVHEGFWLAPPDHLNYFNTDTLPRAMAAHGWEVVEHLGEFPVDIFLLNPDTGSMRDRSKGRNCHFVRVAFEMGLWKDRSLEAVVEFRRGCVRAGVGRNQTVYARPARAAERG